MTQYFNNANQAKLVRFQFWMENQNCETIFVKMVFELLKFVKK